MAIHTPYQSGAILRTPLSLLVALLSTVLYALLPGGPEKHFSSGAVVRLVIMLSILIAPIQAWIWRIFSTGG